MLFINKLFNSIACLLSFTNLQLVIPGRTWILLYLRRTLYKHLWACLVLYNHLLKTRQRWFKQNDIVEFVGPLLADVCNQDRLILPGVDIDIKLWLT